MPACHHPTRPWPAEGRRSRHQKAACLQRLAWPRPTDRPTAARRPVGTAGSPGRPTVPPGVHERRVRGRVTANPNGMDAAGGDGAAVRAGGREEQKGATGRHGTLPHWDGDDGKSAATTGYGAPNGTVSPANPDPPQSPQAGLLAPYVAAAAGAAGRLVVSATHAQYGAGWLGASDALLPGVSCLVRGVLGAIRRWRCIRPTGTRRHGRHLESEEADPRHVGGPGRCDDQTTEMLFIQYLAWHLWLPFGNLQAEARTYICAPTRRPKA